MTRTCLVRVVQAGSGAGRGGCEGAGAGLDYRAGTRLFTPTPCVLPTRRSAQCLRMTVCVSAGVGLPGISDIEGRTQFSLWCILAAPLFLGTDVRNMSQFTAETIGNREAIAINQVGLSQIHTHPSSQVVVMSICR